MFNRLRNKFLILNLSMTSGVIVAAFAFIYFITYGNMEADIRARLNNQPDLQVRVEEPDTPADAASPGATTAHISKDGSNLFHIEVDANGNLLNIDSFADLPDDVYRQAAEIAWNNRNSREVVQLGGRQWRYGITPIRVQVVRGDGVPVTVDEGTFNITFLDVTESRRTLMQLLGTLLFVGLCSIVVIFAVSLYFANRAIRPLRETWDKQKRFVADASHELKTPISIINANYDALVANREDTIANQMKWLDYIRVGTDRMAKLVNDLLMLARIEDAQLPVSKATFSVSREIDDVIRSMEAAAADKQIRLVRSIEPDIFIHGNPDDVRQLAAILFDNAIKYTNAEGWINLSLTKAKRHVVFSISNSGPGIAKDDLPRVFDRFFRADRSRTYRDGSYGLGLSIAKSIVDRLGGRIRADSVENGVTTFSITLPL